MHLPFVLYSWAGVHPHAASTTAPQHIISTEENPFGHATRTANFSSARPVLPGRCVLVLGNECRQISGSPVATDEHIGAIRVRTADGPRVAAVRRVGGGRMDRRACVCTGTRCWCVPAGMAPGSNAPSRRPVTFFSVFLFILDFGSGGDAFGSLIETSRETWRGRVVDRTGLSAPLCTGRTCTLPLAVLPPIYTSTIIVILPEIRRGIS